MFDQRWYQPVTSDTWKGRIDDPEDTDSYRIHQIIQCIDLQTPVPEADKGKYSFCLLGFCCDEGVERNLGRPGAAKGPESIRREYANIPLTFYGKAHIFDAGNFYCIDNNLETAQNNLADGLMMLLEKGYFPIVLGGGHEVAFGHYNGIHNHLKRKGIAQAPAIINFDAHLDMRPFCQGGSSGSMFYQIAEKNRIENTNFDYMCIGTQTCSNTISLFKRADAYGACYIHARDIKESNLADILGKVFRFIDNKKHIYLTVCSDVFSSAYASGVSALQPFGMNPEMIIKIIKEILRTQKVVSFDIAEVSPRFDQDNHTAKLAAILIYTFINTLTEKL